MGGRVSPAAADGTPARVWHNFRGLAMARSIGDHNAKAVGRRRERAGGAKTASALRDDTAPSARLVAPRALAAPTPPGAPPGQLAGRVPRTRAARLGPPQSGGFSTCLHQVGVIAEPEVTTYTVHKDDALLILAAPAG